MVQSAQDRAADDIPGPTQRREETGHPCSMTNECAWRCSNVCTKAERGADGVRRTPRHDQCIPSGLNRSTVLRSRRCNRFVPDTHGTQPACDDRTVDAIPVPDHVARGLIPGECLRYLTRDPFGGRMCRDVDPDEISAV